MRNLSKSSLSRQLRKLTTCIGGKEQHCDPSPSQIFWSPRVVFGSGTKNTQVTKGSVEVLNGAIIGCFPGESRSQAVQRTQDNSPSAKSQERFVDLSRTRSTASIGSSDFCLSPGLIDVHTHISQLGRNWEGYTTATRAAAAGGITTIIGMPLNSLPPTTSVEAVREELQSADQEELAVNVGLWGGVVPDNCDETKLNELLSHPKVLGLKAFLSPLPPAAGYQAVTPEELLYAATVCGKFGKPILVHSELMTHEEIVDATIDGSSNDPTSYRSHVASRPPEWEQRAVKVVLKAATFCDMHIVHLSDGLGCLPLIEKHKQSGRNRTLTVETCPHYLLLDCESIPVGETRVKCVPPIRDASQRDRLWRGLADSSIDMIGSDHSPCQPDLRRKPLSEAWAGLSGLQYQLPATWTEACRRGFTVQDVARWWSHNPAKLANITERGSIEVGKRADFVLWDTKFVGIPNDYGQEYHRWKGDSYFAEMQLRGRVLGTWVNGTRVYDGFSDRHYSACAGEYL